MTYYINPIFFYLMGVTNNIKIAGWIFGVGAPAIALLIMFALSGDWDDEDFSNWWKKTKRIAIPMSIIGLTLALFAPSKDTVKEMMIASVVTEERVDKTVEDVKEFVDYVFEKVNESEEGNK